MITLKPTTVKALSITLTLLVVFSCGATSKEKSTLGFNPIPTINTDNENLNGLGTAIDDLASVPIEIPSNRYFVNYEMMQGPYDTVIVVPQEGLMYLLAFGDILFEIEEPTNYTGLMKKTGLTSKKPFNWKTYEGMIILTNLLAGVEQLDLDELLFEAIKHNAEAGAVYYLLQQGADPNYNKYILLYLAALDNNRDVIELLTRFGAENTGSAEFLCKTQIEQYQKTISTIRSTVNFH
jgi:hypothetical protein